MPGAVYHRRSTVLNRSDLRPQPSAPFGEALGVKRPISSAHQGVLLRVLASPSWTAVQSIQCTWHIRIDTCHGTAEYLWILSLHV